MKRTVFGFAIVAGLLSGLAAPRAASATNHITRLDQVMIGAFGRKDIQYVIVSHQGCDQTAWGVQFAEVTPRAGLFFFDANNNPVGQFLIPTNPTCDSGSVLIGTQAFADLPAPVPDPDFIMPVLGVPGGGKVCFKDNPANLNSFDVALCLTYGNFTGDDEQASTNNAVALPLQDICALKRNGLTGFGAPNRNEDFGLLPPAPKNTHGDTGAVTVPPRFGDVPASNPLFRFIEAMFNSGVTSGCGGGNYCPGAVINREQMAVFLLLAKEGPTFSPPACIVPTFADVPCSSPFARWIEELVRRGVTSGCGGGNYCPANGVTRGQMAVFLSTTFGLPLPVLPANTACAAPACAHSKCTIGVALNADCDACVGQICAGDPFCCNNTWDSTCVGEVSSVCHQTCP
jgi:S-layer family protein